MKAIEFPNIGIIENNLSEEQINYLKECIKNKGKPYKNNLVGNIHNSFELHDKNNWFFNNVLTHSIIYYQNSFFNLGSMVPVKGFHNYILSSWWVNYQKKHDFNPIHSHHGIYSFVIWMKVPTNYREQHNISIAKGIDSGTIDVLIVGKKINKKFLDEIHPKIEKKIKRKINFLVSSTGSSQEGLVVFE